MIATTPASPDLRDISLLDRVRFSVFHTFPFYLQGLFTRSRFWVTFFSALHPDPLSVAFVSGLRRKYRSNYLDIGLGRTKTLLVLNEQSIRRVLERSPEIYGESKTKRQGMSRFQPGALTITDEAGWRSRRQFNEQVLGSCSSLHRYAEHFLGVVRDEVTRMMPPPRGTFDWNGIERLFERISLRIILGRSAAEDRYLPRSLVRLMHNANRARFVGPDTAAFDGFYASLRGYLRWPARNSLAELCEQLNTTDGLKAEQQIVHWMFAMNETLAANTARALVVILTDPDVYQSVGRELSSVDISSPSGIDRLSYVEGCLQEAMRLWPTTPILMREAKRRDFLGAAEVAPGTNIMILNAFNHRDRDSDPNADRFLPESWAGRPARFRFNHLSNGARGCAGLNLALFLGKAVLAWLLSNHRYWLVRPILNPRLPLPHALNYFKIRILRLDERGDAINAT